jgi:hypothetical protein
VSLKAIVTTAAPAGGKPPKRQDLSFRMQPQTQTNWCWAATSTSVSHYFDHGSTWSQCKVANKTLSMSDCCGGGANGPCNIPYYLDQALTSTGNFDRFADGAEVPAKVRSEIKAGRPLCIRVGWAGGGGHFLCIIGWIEAANGTLYYVLADPIYGVSRVTLDTLRGSYQGSGTWTHSYFVRSLPAGGMVVAAAAPRARPGTMGA